MNVKQIENAEQEWRCLKYVELITMLEVIARKNKDQFKYKIDINVNHRGFSFRFVATETVDGHEFLIGRGATIQAAIADAMINVEGSCKRCGYLT
jgi:hypothetical protein